MAAEFVNIIVKAIAPTPLVPKTFEPPTRHPRVSGGVFWVPMPKVILGRAEIDALVGQIVATGVAQHVRMNMPEPSPQTGGLDDVVDSLPGHLVTAF